MYQAANLAAGIKTFNATSIAELQQSANKNNDKTISQNELSSDKSKNSLFTSRENVNVDRLELFQ